MTGLPFLSAQNPRTQSSQSGPQLAGFSGKLHCIPPNKDQARDCCLFHSIRQLLRCAGQTLPSESSPSDQPEVPNQGGSPRADPSRTFANLRLAYWFVQSSECGLSVPVRI